MSNARRRGSLLRLEILSATACSLNCKRAVRDARLRYRSLSGQLLKQLLSPELTGGFPILACPPGSRKAGEQAAVGDKDSSPD